MFERTDEANKPGQSWALRVLSGLLYLILATSLRAQVSPVGPEFQVNTYVDGVQHEPSVDFDGAGNFVVIWNDEYVDFRGIDYNRPRAQSFPPDGEPAGPELFLDGFRISRAASLAVQDGGEFVVVRSVGDYFAGNSEVTAMLFDTMGGRTDYFQVNSVTSWYQLSPSVAATPGAGFVVVWESYESAGTDHSSTSIQTRQFTADGVPISADLQVNSHTTGHQRSAKVAVQPSGDFVVVWQSAGPIEDDASGRGIRARLFDSSGEPASDEFQVNSFTPDDQLAPVIATFADGGFVIAWQSEGSFENDDSDLSVQARLYTSTGEPLNQQFQVNSYTTGSQREPAVAADPTGTFAITWTSDGSMETDSTGGSVQARRYRADGRALTNEFQVNTYTTSRQESPAVSFSPNGDFVVTWKSEGSTGDDASESSIQARRFQGLFADGFDGGSMLRWWSEID